jgi:hypothetical protein
MDEFDMRDLFAGLAMVGLLVKNGYNMSISTQAYVLADEMLLERSKDPQEEIGIAAITKRKK